MSEVRVSEPSRDGNITVRKVRRNRKGNGKIVTYPNKISVYWIERRTDTFHRATRSWLFDTDTISAVRIYGVTHIGIYVEDGSTWLTRVANFGLEGQEHGVLRARSNTYVDERGNRGALCWHVPETLWARLEPSEAMKHAFMSEERLLKRQRERKPKSVLTV